MRASFFWKLGGIYLGLLLGVLLVALLSSSSNPATAQFRSRILIASCVALLLASFATVAFSRAFSARVTQLRDFSRRLAGGDSRPLPSGQPSDELASLADSLNEAAAQLERTIESLSGERHRASAILRSMVEGVAVIDAREKIVFANRAFSNILNLDNSAIEGRPVIEVLRNTKLLGLIRRVLRGEEGLTADIAMGIVQQRSFSVTATPVRALDASIPTTATVMLPLALSADKLSGAVLVLHDMTELRRLERVRQDFVANVSHEFKTPLTAIQGFAETLIGGAIDDPGNNRRFLAIIRDHAARLASLTDDLLKLARIEAGKLELDFYPVGLTELVERCAETALLKATRKQIALQIEIPPGLPAVRGDAGLLTEVLQNLLDNAIQYTTAGGRICVTAGTRGREAVISVSDTGIGIPLADQERIFERFYRVDAARSREAGGTGLGLSIARHIVDAHGGRIWIHSEVGAGSTFSFSIPLAA
ncbi:MAG TPA: ATP-binding protein [Candidatus Dormibacteraeota bacterium]|nr:ATP-binding protein [Candidatus Dormibacteraeota bacterium]